MQLWEAGAVMAAGVAAGAINAAVGSGTLITFPTLVALGVPPVVANISNNLGLVPGSVAGAWGYRVEVAEQGAALRRLAPASAVGGVAGALLLLVLPARAFEVVVPVLIALALLLVVAQPWLARRVAARRHPSGDVGGQAAPDGASVRPNAGATTPGGTPADQDAASIAPKGASVAPEGASVAPEGASAGPEGASVAPGRAPAGPVAILACAAAGVYGGYFGAAQGVLLIGILGWLVSAGAQQANALKNALAGLVNLVAGVTFVLAAPDRVRWSLVALIAVGATVGGLLGAALARRLPPAALRGLIVVVGAVAMWRLVAG